MCPFTVAAATPPWSHKYATVGNGGCRLPAERISYAPVTRIPHMYVRIGNAPVTRISHTYVPIGYAPVTRIPHMHARKQEMSSHPSYVCASPIRMRAGKR
jgi:hypothetical protein